MVSGGQKKQPAEEAMGDPSLIWIADLEKAATLYKGGKHAEAAKETAQVIEAILPYAANPYLNDAVQELKTAQMQLEGGGGFKVDEAFNNAGHLIERAHSI